MNKVLFIAYYFPPLGMGGVQRSLKFAKYLPDFGWQPVVFTTGEMAYYAHDEKLLNEIPQCTLIYRSNLFNPLATLCLLTGVAQWQCQAYRLKLAQKRPEFRLQHPCWFVRQEPCRALRNSIFGWKLIGYN